MREAVRVYLPFALLIAAGFAIAWAFVDPAPPERFAFAAGPKGGPYDEYAARYKAILAKSGIAIDIVETAGSAENLRRMGGDAPQAEAALLQGGVGSEEGFPGLATLASVFYEPVWLVLRGDLPVGKLYDLRGRRVAVGADGSDTQILVRQLLRANGLDSARDIAPVPLDIDAAFAALAGGAVDAAFFVAERAPAPLAGMLAAGTHRLFSFERHEAYRLQFPFLSSVVLPAGGIELGRDLPPAATTLLAPAAQLVVREDMHPALVGLLLRAAKEVHAGRHLFAPAGAFPTLRYADFDLHEDSVRLMERGPSVLSRILPFWAAVQVERLSVMAIPLLTLLIPLARIAPPAYRWQVRGKIFSKYKALRRIEAEIRVAESSDRRAQLMAELDDVQAQVAALRVPTSYADILYNLHLHIQFVREIVAPR